MNDKSNSFQASKYHHQKWKSDFLSGNSNNDIFYSPLK